MKDEDYDDEDINSRDFNINMDEDNYYFDYKNKKNLIINDSNL
jgi:hypothetical protein